MLIVDEYSQPILLDNLYGPIMSNYMWVLDLTILDYTVIPIVMLEETVCSSIQITVDGLDIILPSHWCILIYDIDTLQLDIIEISETLGKEFTAFVYNSVTSTYSTVTIQASNYFVEYKHVTPSFNKSHMLCYPISKIHWICLSPSNSYNKYLKDKTVLDLLY